VDVPGFVDSCFFHTTTTVSARTDSMHGKKRAEYKARLKDDKTAAAMEAKAEQ
jgi:hypothetical protein